MDQDKIIAQADALAKSVDTDVILFNGALNRPEDTTFLDLFKGRRRRKNVMLLLCTTGGDASVAYRIARFLQGKYDHVTICVAGYCKSAGTLLALGGHELVMSDCAELGPLDVQLGKKDELWESDSGLTVLTAIKALEEKAYELYESSLINIKAGSQSQVTFRTASDLAAKLASGIISPIVAQIDPMHVGEVTRAMKIGVEYGERLSRESGNPKPNTISKLSDGYPSHGFVIDRKEAATLFNHVREPNQDEALLIELLEHMVQDPRAKTFMMILSNALPEEAHGEQDKQPTEVQPTEGSGSGEPQQAAGTETAPPAEANVTDISAKLRSAGKP